MKSVRLLSFIVILVSKHIECESWTAKISDIGLAKLLMPDQIRTYTGARGTRGYVAPEWHKNIAISVKADDCSYEIVLLKILCCRKNVDVRELNKLVIGEEVDKMSLEKMVKVGLWSVQIEPALRPSMKSVIFMLC